MARSVSKKTVLKKLKLQPTQIIALAFAAIILAGTLLLMLPVASREGKWTDFVSALFTATSATCVTGLTVFDTGSSFSGFGQTVILCMIEIGGLGFMSMASLFIFTLRKKIGLKQRMIMAQALSVNEMESVVRLQKWVLIGSLVIQLTGASVLFIRFLFLTQFNIWQSVVWAVFHAVSAFCNAGFDVFGQGTNMIPYQADPVVLITLMALVVVGGLGFFVWEEVARVRAFKKFSVYTKLVLITTAVLLTVGAALFLLLEWHNPYTFGPMTWPQKILNACFQSVTVRTAGFMSVDQAVLTDGSKAISILLMLIGGASGSTAGGVKMITMLVLVLFVVNRARGKKTVTVFKRTVPQDKVLDAATIVTLVGGLAVAGAVLITVTSPVGFIDALYEAVSALATVGLTAGVTPVLSLPAKLMIIVFMYFGRVGILTISLGFMMGDKAEGRYQYAQTNLLIG